MRTHSKGPATLSACDTIPAAPPFTNDMGDRRTKTAILILTALLACVGARAQETEDKGGDLRIYHRATQIGTTAMRTFRDAKGRVVKTIYYTGGGGGLVEGPYLEELLREQSIETVAYDEHDCRVRGARYAPGMKLLNISLVRCRKGTDVPEHSVALDADGRRVSETWHDRGGGTASSRFFGADGERVIAVDGHTRADVDLADGWGETVGGFALGIATDRMSGQQGELSVWVTVKNLTHADGVVDFAPLAFELRDAAGRPVEPHPDWAPRQSGPAPGQCPALAGQGAPFVGRSDYVATDALRDIFPPLTPGKYTLTYKYCISTTHLPLVSNTITFEVRGRN